MSRPAAREPSDFLGDDALSELLSGSAHARQGAPPSRFPPLVGERAGDLARLHSLRPWLAQQMSTTLEAQGSIRDQVAQMRPDFLSAPQGAPASQVPRLVGERLHPFAGASLHGTVDPGGRDGWTAIGRELSSLLSC